MRRMRRQDGRWGRRGVTLIELLVTLVILGMIATVVSLTMHVGVEAWRTGVEVADESHHADVVMEQIVMALRSAYYPEGKEPNELYGFQFEDGGEMPKAQDVFSWVKVGQSLIGEDVPWSGAAHRVELFVDDEQGEQGPGLYVKAWQLVGQAEDFDAEEDVVPLLLSDQVLALNCQMKDPDKALTLEEPYEWLDEWSTSNRIPTHVKISLAIRPQNGREEPMEYTRCIEIPMAKMSWDPIDTAAVEKETASGADGHRGESGAIQGGRRGPGGIRGGGVRNVPQQPPPSGHSGTVLGREPRMHSTRGGVPR